MGILTDLFVATTEDARAYDPARSNRTELLAKYQPAEYKHLTYLEFSTLWAILAEEPWDFDKHHHECLHLPAEGETWLFRFPEAFVLLLAGLTDSKLEAVVTAWAQTEELASWSTTDLKPMVVDLRRLAQQASQTSKGLFLWGSL